VAEVLAAVHHLVADLAVASVAADFLAVVLEEAGKLSFLTIKKQN
jgi:hypothetical protein